MESLLSSRKKVSFSLRLQGMCVCVCGSLNTEQICKKHCPNLKPVDEERGPVMKLTAGWVHIVSFWWELGFE